MICPALPLLSQDSAKPIEHHVDRGSELRPLAFGEHAFFAIDRKDRFSKAAGAFLRKYEVGGGEAGFEPFQPLQTVFSSLEHTVGDVAVSLRYLDSHMRQTRSGGCTGQLPR